jgi:hypothetical protein
MEQTQNWIETLDPDVVNKITMRGVKVEAKIGDVVCKLTSMCPSHTSVFITIEALVNKMKPTDLLKHCIVCKTDARTIFERFIRRVEVREDGYLFVVRGNDGDMRLIYENLDDAFEDLNETPAKHHHFAIDDNEFYEFIRLTHARATQCPPLQGG